MTPSPAAPVDAARNNRRAALALTIVLLVGIDVVSKTLAVASLGAGRSIDLTIIELRLSYNPGVAFNMGDTLPGWVVLSVTAAITVALAIYVWYTATTMPRTSALALSAILAGATANLVDRVGDGKVTDYLHTGWFPTFNLADTYIMIGATLAVLVALLGTKGGSAPGGSEL